MTEWCEDFQKRHPHLCEEMDLIIMPPTYSEVVEEYPDAACEPELAAGEIRFAKGCHDDTGHGLTVLALYVQCRRNGTPHNFAMMLALQRAPGVETSDTFWAGRKRFDQVFGEPFANTIKAGFAKQGINLKPGDEYCPELCRPGYSVKNPDPEAIVPFNDARGYIRTLMKKRGWECHGSVETTAREPLTDPLGKENCVPLAPDLVAALAREAIAENPDLHKKPKKELAEMIVEKHGPSS